MNERTIYLFERGINGVGSIFGDWKQWPNQAVAWVHNFSEKKKLCWRAQTLEYFTGPVGAGLTRHHRATQFADMMRKYKGWRIIIAAHSEGTATVGAALRMKDAPRVDELHLVCGAIDGNFESNGLNLALKTNRVNKIFDYVAGRDEAMWAENTILGKLFFEIPCRDRSLGYMKEPAHVSEAQKHRVKVIRGGAWKKFGHSDCWLPHNFDDTMLEIIGGR